MPDPSFSKNSSDPDPRQLRLPTATTSNSEKSLSRYVIEEQVRSIVKALDATHPNLSERERILEQASKIITALVDSGQEMVVCGLQCERGAASVRPSERFEIGSALSELLSRGYLRCYHQKTLDQHASACRAEVAEALARVQIELSARPAARHDGAIARFLDTVCIRDVELRRKVRGELLDTPPQVPAAVQEEIAVSLISYLEEREHSLRTRAVISVLTGLLDGELHPTDRALYEVQRLCRGGGDIFLTILAKERASAQVPSMKAREVEDEWVMSQLVQLTSTLLWCVVSKNMSASAASQVGLALASLGRERRLEKAVTRLARLVKHSACSLSLHDERMPEPVGRAAYVGAIKQVFYKAALGDRPHELVAEVPEDPHAWNYVGQRLAYIAGIKDGAVRDARIIPYIASLREYFASAKFYRLEETYFRQLHLEGSTSRDLQEFYSDHYQIDDPLGKEGTVEAERPRKETADAFRIMAAGRYGLNVRAVYSRSFAGQPWLLEDMATQLQGRSERFRVTNREAYPGPGIRISDLRVGNAVDLSTHEARKKYIGSAPWLRTALKVDGIVDYYYFRGFQILTRSFEAAAGPLSGQWLKAGSFGDVPYAAILFNDHFHNQRLPEVRMWLVPECVVHRKLALALENGIDINRLDCTPEGFAEDAKAAGLTIFDVGNSDVFWGSFANAWPYGEGPAFSWETYSVWAKSPWQSPRHIHRALSREDYQEDVTPRVLEWINKARVEHSNIHKRVQFFLDLHSSFLTMEEAWAKDYANAEEGPAHVGRSSESQGSAGETREDEVHEPDAELDLTVRRSRTRILEHFLAIRNEIARSNPQATFEDFPILELQYTRLFARQADTYSLSGADMALYDSGGRRIPIFRGIRGTAPVIREEIHLDEPLEAAWVRCFESYFALGNTPRIRML